MLFFFSLSLLPPSPIESPATGESFFLTTLSLSVSLSPTPFPKKTKLAGFLALLSQLTVVADTSREAFDARFDEMELGEGEGEEESKKKKSSCYQIFVVEETEAKKIVATATLLLEKKFIRGCGLAGHIEDVVVDESVRGKKLGLR